MRLSALVLLLRVRIPTGRRQSPLGPRDAALDPAGDDRDDADAERRHLDTQRVCIGVQRGLGGVVHAPEDVRHHTGQAADHDDRAFRFNQQRRKDLAQAHDGEDVGFEDIADGGEVDVQRGDGVVDAGVVDEVVEAAAAEQWVEGVEERLDGCFRVNGQGEDFDPPRGERAQRGGRTGGGEDAEIGGVEGKGQGMADTAGGAARRTSCQSFVNAHISASPAEMPQVSQCLKYYHSGLPTAGRGERRSGWWPVLGP